MSALSPCASRTVLSFLLPSAVSGGASGADLMRAWCAARLRFVPRVPLRGRGGGRSFKGPLAMGWDTDTRARSACAHVDEPRRMCVEK